MRVAYLRAALTLCASLIYGFQPPYALRAPYELRSPHVLRQPLHAARAGHSLRELYALRLWHPCLLSNLIHEVRLTFYQQPQKVSKKGRSPARLYSLCVSTNTGRENVFPTRLSLRLHPCNRPSVSLQCSRILESRKGCFVVRLKV